MSDIVRVIILVAALAACTPPVKVAEKPNSVCVRSYQQEFAVDPRFDEVDLWVMNVAAEEWREFSDGRVDAHFGRGPANAQVSWVTSDDKLVAQHDAQKAQGTWVLGWTEMDKQKITVVFDRIEDLKVLMMHELGHSAGLKFSNQPSDPFHIPQEAGEAVMTEKISSPTFTGLDKNFCRASCLCP